MCGMDFSSSVRFRFQFGFEKNRRFGSGFFVDQLIEYKKTCKLSFLCVHFAVF